MFDPGGSCVLDLKIIPKAECWPKMKKEKSFTIIYAHIPLLKMKKVGCHQATLAKMRLPLLYSVQLGLYA